MDSNQKKLVHNYFQKRDEEWQTNYESSNLSSIIIQQRENYVLKFIDELKLKKGSKILDLGCGAGLTSKKLLDRGFEVFGIDVSENMILRADKNCQKDNKNGSYKFQKGDAESLAFPTETFDVVIAMGLIEYLTYYRWALQEMQRVIKPKGHLIVTVPNQIRLSYLLDPIQSIFIISGIIKTLLKRLKPILNKNGILNLYRKIKSKTRSSTKKKIFKRKLYYPRQFNVFLNSIGYEIVNSVSHGFGPFRILWFSKILNKKLNYVLEKIRLKYKNSIIQKMGENYIVVCRKKDNNIDTYKKYIFGQTESLNKYFDHEKILLELWKQNHSIQLNTSINNIDTNEYKNQNILVLSPHPDDEIIGCGGTIIKLIKSGASVTILQLTDGSDCEVLWEQNDQVTRSTIRIKEAENVANALGAKELIAWKEKDGSLCSNPVIIEKLSKIIESLQPSLIFVPFINDAHKDHYMTNRLLVNSLISINMDISKITILSYEVWSLVPINSYCTIDDVFFQKVDLLYKYITAMKDTNYIQRCEYLASCRSQNITLNNSLVENYFNQNATDYANSSKDIEYCR